MAQNHLFCTFWSKFSKIRLKKKKKNPTTTTLLEVCINMVFTKFQHFKLKIDFYSRHKFFLTKNVIFCRFVQKSTILVKFDIKNGLSDSFPFQKCILLYTPQLQFKSYGALYFSHFYGLTPTLRGHNWQHFAHRPQCTVTLNSNFAIFKT